MNYPRMAAIRQNFSTNSIKDIVRHNYSQLAKTRSGETDIARTNVAITAGSRGIANINTFTQTVSRK